jgi:hypothetical protein
MLLLEDTLAASNLGIGSSPSPSLMTLGSDEDGVDMGPKKLDEVFWFGYASCLNTLSLLKFAAYFKTFRTQHPPIR